MTRCEHSLKPTAHGEKPQGWRSIEPIIGSSANPGYRDFAIAAEIVKNRKIHDRVSFDVNPTSVCHHQFRRQGSSFGQRHATSFGDQTRSDAGGCRALRGWFAQAQRTCSLNEDCKCSWEALQ